MAGIGSLLKSVTKGAKAIQEAAEASKLALPRSDRYVLPGDAIDDQNAVIESIMAPLQEEISAILDLAKQHGKVYVRWAGDAKHDLSKNARSRDYQTGQMHEGLSAVDVTADMSPSDVARRLQEYGFNRASTPNSRPRVYLADRVGIDSDGYDSIRPRQLLREPSDEALMALDSDGAELLVLEERLSDALDMAARITDPMAKKLTQELIDKTRQEIAEARQNIVEIAARGARKAEDMAIGGIVKGAAKQARRIGDEFDPRFDPRKKEQERLQNLEVAVEPRPLDRPEVSIADFEGSPFVTSMSDRTAAGGMLTDVRGVPLSEPVNLRGGQDFMFDYNPGQVWASAKPQASNILSVAQRARHKTGQDPIFLPWRMAPQGGDFATMTGETMLSFARDSMNKKTKRSLDSRLKKIIPNWPGVDSPDAIDVFRAAPDKARKAAKNIMDVEFRDRGGLSIGEARLAVADPAQLDAQQGGVQNVGRILADREVNFSTHPTYPMAVPGEGVGVLKEDINVFELLPDIVEARNIPDPLKPRDTDLRSMQMGAKAGRITPELLRKILGGGAGAAVGIEALLQEEAQAAPLMAPGMALGGAVSKAIARLMEAGMPREIAERVVRGEMPPALPDRAPPRLTFSADNPKAIGAIPNILNFVDDPAYQILEKDLIPEMVMMSPDEYITEASRILSRQSPGEADFDNVVRSRTQDMEYLQGIQDLLDQGADFQVPFLDYRRGGQEGLHRTIAARNLGEEQIPVMVMRSARGDNYIPLTQAEQDAINAARLEDLRAKGYPESTVQKIMGDELSMNPEIRRERAYRQGKRQRLFHAGSPELATATELDPDAGRFGRSGSGVWMTPEPVLANTYVPPGVENAGAMYEFLVDDSKFPIFIGSGNWDEAVGDLYSPDYDRILEDVSGTTNEIARQVREMGYPGMKFTGISDVGPNYRAAKRSAEMIAPQYGMEPKELLDSTIGDRAVDDYEVYTIFDPSVARSPYAAFDPDQVDSPNLLAGLAPYAVPTVLGGSLLGAAMAPEEAEAAPFGTLARMLGKRTQETFHGSPHIFDQVDMSRMGSGEGTQFEGAGFYSAGARPTAESYQRDLSGYYGGSDAVEQRAYSDLFDLAEEYAGDRDPEDVLDEIMSSIANEDYSGLPAPLQAPAEEFAERSRGALYRTEIPAEDLLDWDRPLAEQPGNIRAAVMDTARAARADAADPGAIDLEALPGMTGGDAYEQLRAVYGNGASAELNNRGVLGVQYLDAASREAGEGTRNYVVFDEANVNVVERDGQPIAALPRGRTLAGAAGLAGAGMLASPEEAEAAGFGTLARAIGRPTRAAYTGSAAKYARPSLQSVGTGEGNQAFGYGLYFSDSPEIAGGYRRNVSGQKVLDRMSDRYLLDDLDLQSVDEMLDLGEFDLEDEKLIRALQGADYLGFDRPMDAVRAAFGPDLNAFDASDPAVQKLKGIADEVGFLYEVEVPAEDFIDWNLTLDEQPKVVQQVVRQNAQDPRIRDKIDAGSFRGSDAYYLFGNNPEVNSAMWAQYGVPGVRYNSFGRAVRGLDEARARKDAPQNYVVFDENLINIVRRNDEALEGNFDEMAARAAATDVRKPLAAILGAGAAGAAQAGQDDTFGDYDQRAVAIATEALDRLQREAKMKEGSIGPGEVLEAAATIGSSILGSVPAGLAGLYTLATTGDREAAEAKINEITESLTYMPSSQGSIDALQAAVGPLEALAAPSEYVGQKTLDITGSPLLATASEIFLDPLNLLSFGGLGAALKRAGRAQ